jgi:hypothetical protein
MVFEDFTFDRFRPALAGLPPGLTEANVTRESLLIAQQGPLAIYYAPFDHVNENAKVILMGITPGRHQMFVACRFVSDSIAAGMSDAEILHEVKSRASFSGPMRKNLVTMLDGIGLQDALGIRSSASLFDVDAELLFPTSAVSFPCFVRGKNYTGASPPLLKQPILVEIARQVFARRVQLVHGALIIPLGKTASEVLDLFISEGLVDRARCLRGFPHPSSGNGHRVREYRENLDALRTGVAAWFSRTRST